jgi:2-polyprenyl-6-methoxyphenol hydroxylase-like FAD-dependent oxidoreductase
LSNHGVRSLINCIPPSVASNLPEAFPNTILDVEDHGISITDHTGNLLFQPRSKKFKDVYEFSKISGFTLAVCYRDRFRDILSEKVPIQWDKKCIGYEEIQDGVWVIFEDGSREFCDILVGADGINSPSKFNIFN